MIFPFNFFPYLVNWQSYKISSSVENWNTKHSASPVINMTRWSYFRHPFSVFEEGFMLAVKMVWSCTLQRTICTMHTMPLICTVQKISGCPARSRSSSASWLRPEENVKEYSLFGYNDLFKEWFKRFTRGFADNNTIDNQWNELTDTWDIFFVVNVDFLHGLKQRFYLGLLFTFIP